MDYIFDEFEDFELPEEPEEPESLDIKDVSDEMEEFYLGKVYEDTNVYEAAKRRIQVIFEEFDHIQISFSAGKDSGVMLHMILDYIKENKPKNKVSLFTMDYECNYDETNKFAEEMHKLCEPYMDIYNVCLPVKAQCSINSNNPYWRPWDISDKKIWVRDLPENSVNENNAKSEFAIDFDYKKLNDYEFNMKFSEYLHKRYKAKKTAVLIGIRTDESLNRFRTIANKKNRYKGLIYSTKTPGLDEDVEVYNLYPIYDWHVEDVWAYHGKFDKPYNKLYDLMNLANVPYGSMRVASPFNDSAISSLKMYKVLNPNMWGKMIGRVEGVNTAALYGDTSAYGWKDIKLPKNHSWQSYTDFLLGTLEESARDKYIKKFKKSIDFWLNYGGAVDEETKDELERVKMPYTNHGPKSKMSKKDVITLEYYPDELDIKNWRVVGTYKRMAVAILKNDHTCKTLGFGPTKEENTKRKNAEKMIKKIKG